MFFSAMRCWNIQHCRRSERERIEQLSNCGGWRMDGKSVVAAVEHDAVSVDVPADVARVGSYCRNNENGPAGTPPGGSVEQLKNQKSLSYCWRLQDARHSAIRVLIVHKEKPIGIHKVNDRNSPSLCCSDEFNGHGMSRLELPVLDVSIAGDRDGTAGDEIEDGTRSGIGRCRLRQSSSGWRLSPGRRGLLHLERKNPPPFWRLRPLQLIGVGSRDIAAGEWSARWAARVPSRRRTAPLLSRFV